MKKKKQQKKLQELEIERINKIKELEKKQEKIADITKESFIIPKEIPLPYFLRYVCQLIKQAKEKKVSKKCIKITEILKDVIIKKETDEEVDAFEKQLRPKYMKLIN